MSKIEQRSGEKKINSVFWCVETKNPLFLLLKPYIECSTEKKKTTSTKDS